jgi:hypothetical protein
MLAYNWRSMQYFAFLEDQLYALSMKQRLSCFAQWIECEKTSSTPRSRGNGGTLADDTTKGVLNDL